MCLNETYITVCIDRNLIRFLFRMAWNKETLYHHCLLTLLWNTPSGGSKRTRSKGLKLYGTHELLPSADGIYMVG
jgi:hypothetical protein